MTKLYVFAAFLAALPMAACNPADDQAAAPPAEEAEPAPPEMSEGPPTTDGEIIESAMSAAPPAVGQAATIVAISDDGSMRMLREGTNNYTCMGDNPATPGPDPMCGDAAAMAWAEAWIAGETPPAGVGFMYMLKGGTDASNTDPFATEPTEGGDWISTGPHVMIVGAESMHGAYPSEPVPDTSQPYVMWAGTPYAHLMIPTN
jgi:hypothetical protein